MFVNVVQFGAFDMTGRTTGARIRGGIVVVDEGFTRNGMIHRVCSTKENVFKFCFGEGEALKDVDTWNLDLGTVTNATIFFDIGLAIATGKRTGCHCVGTCSGRMG